MKKKQTTVRSSSVVRAKKRGGSGLPVAAQRARSRQIEATLKAAIRSIWDVQNRSVRKLSDQDWKDLSNAANGLLDLFLTERSRRLFGANVRLSDRSNETNAS